MEAKHTTNVSDHLGPDRTTVVAEKYADETLRIIEDHGKEFEPLTPERERVLVRKLYLHVMGLLLAINLVLFVSFTMRHYSRCW